MFSLLGFKHTYTHTRTHQLFAKTYNPMVLSPVRKKRLLLQPSAITSKGFSLNKHFRERKKGRGKAKKKGRTQENNKNEGREKETRKLKEQTAKQDRKGGRNERKQKGRNKGE